MLLSLDRPLYVTDEHGTCHSNPMLVSGRFPQISFRGSGKCNPKLTRLVDDMNDFVLLLAVALTRRSRAGGV